MPRSIILNDIFLDHPMTTKAVSSPARSKPRKTVEVGGD